MAQDFAKKKSPTAKPQTRAKSTPAKPKKRKGNTRKASSAANTSLKKAPLWLWLLVGIGLMAFALFLSQISSDNKPQKSQTANPVATPENKPTSQVRFDFYEILKGHEVQVDDKVIEATPKTSNIIYWLQVASFRQAKDADQLRAKLLLVNLAASTEKTQSASGENWHRVMVGPFTSRSNLAKARSILASNELNGIVIKRKAQP